MPETKLPLVVVEWNDAWIKEAGVTLEDVGATHVPTVVTTIGWMMKDDEVGISLANEFYDDTYRGRTFIPRGMVKTVTPYRLTKPRKAKAAEEAAGQKEEKKV